MIFNKTSYYIPNKTKNNTNVKDYSSIENNFTIIADFRLFDFVDNEATIISKDGYPMGLFLELPNIVKFVWHTTGNTYNDVRFIIDDIKQRMNIKVTVSESIGLYFNDVLMDSKVKGDIIDYSEKRLLIGSLYPFNGKNDKWFNGDINNIIIYDTLVDYTDKNMYINMNFEENSKFKTFDNSGNGNHGILIEDPEYVNKSIDMFNNVAPKQKII
jgi:hypothetical protein